MRKQYAVLGLGNFGESIAITLQQKGCDVIAMDKHMEPVEAISNYVSYAMQADMGDSEVIRSLEPRKLDGVIVAVADDMEANIMACLVAKELGAPYVLAKAKNERHGEVLKKIGVDEVIFPEKVMGERIAGRLVSEDMPEWMHLSTEYSIIERVTPKAWVGKSLNELDVRKNYGVNVVGISENNKVSINIDPDEPLREMQILTLIGTNDDLNKI